MTWIPLLLTDPSPCLRYLTLKELLKRPDDDPEVKELAGLRKTDPLVEDLLKFQKPNGAWDSNILTGVAIRDNIQLTSMSMQRLGYLGYDTTHPAVEKAAEFIFSKQKKDGSWPMSGKIQRTDEEYGYQMMPVQTAIPLLGLVMCGYAMDERAENAYEWLLEQRLEDGAWPVGIAQGVYGRIAGYRHLSHSRLGCRSNTTAVLSCLAYHPKRRKSEEAYKALDLILSTDTKLKSNLGFYVARLIGLEKSIGRITFMAKFDIAHVLNLCWRVGASMNDERVTDFIKFIQDEQGKYGLWEYSGHPMATRWISFDLLRSLSKLDFNTEWMSLEPRTPFQAYPKKNKRY
ncbi:MAG: prenyltransferase/squalene oxidase repeat-containing protein [Promethearchaeota archaeon]